MFAHGYPPSYQPRNPQPSPRRNWKTNPRPPRLSWSAMESVKQILEQVKTATDHSNNSVCPYIPIHRLPVEIIARIFQLLIGTNCAHRPAKWHLYPQSLSLLMSTCDRWRRVIINSPFLWTHIDLTVKSGYARIPQLNYANLCVKRAAQRTLELHIVEYNYFEGRSKLNLLFSAPQALLITFITSIAPRVGSFLFKLSYPALYRRPLYTLFHNCAPGTLTTLHAAFQDPEVGPHKVFFSRNLSINERALLGGLSKEQAEEIVQGVTALRLGFMRPVDIWASNTCHGLVELRFTALEPFKVEESEFVGILRENPGLRILECATPFRLSWGDDEPIDPISLPDLEVVNFGHCEFRALGNIARWLAPGSKPLQILLNKASFEPKMLAFFARSNVTRLYCRDYRPPVYVVHHLPRLQSLAFGSHYWFSCKPSIPAATPPILLEVLYIINSELGKIIQDLHSVVSLHSLRRVIFYRCFDPDPEEFIAKVPEHVRSRVEFTIVSDDEPNPVGEWEMFSSRVYE